MRDIEERDDLTSESDLEMTDVQDMHMLNLHQIGKADSFALITNTNGGLN